ncbi:MAG: hypothetical protein NNA30_11490 [Nitrospira sp.]|nr:hypothetical protein [Nitrospira sp.]
MDTKLEAGDILAFHGTDWLSLMIRFWTFGPSHVGIIVDHGRHLVLFEATSRNATDCLFAGTRVSGAQFSNPHERIGSCIRDGGFVDIWKPAAGAEPDPLQRHRMEKLALRLVMIGAGYDYSGALLSGTRIASRFDFLLPEERRYQLFCSSAVHQILETAGMVNKDNSSRYSPARLMRMLNRQGIYRRFLRINRDNWEEFARRAGAFTPPKETTEES